jgi:hypothetical protein
MTSTIISLFLVSLVLVLLFWGLGMTASLLFILLVVAVVLAMGWRTFSKRGR